jgi:hypothetical protein
MPAPSQETTNAVTVAHFERIEEKIDEVKETAKTELAEVNKRLDKLLEDKEKALIWGATSIGMVLIGLVGWLFTHAKDILKW